MHVVVAGGGPVGLSLAALLTHAGIRVTVLEQQDRVGRESRASTWHPSTLEVLDKVGVADPLVEEGVVVDRLQYRHQASGLVAEFDYQVLADETDFPFRVQAEQGRVTPYLLDYLAAAPHAAVEFGARVVNVHDYGSRVGAVVEGRSAEVEGDYLVGADGAHSAVRHALGVSFDGEAYPRRMLRIYTGLDLRSLLPDVAPATYVAGPWGSGSMLSLPDHWRIAFRVEGSERDEQATEPEHIQGLMSRLLPAQSEPYAVRGAEVVALHKRVASAFRVGRVFLIGDAAHINNPSGGFGMNSGIHDAYGMGRVLAGLTDGQLDDAAADRVVAERRQVVIERVLGRSDLQARNLDAGAGSERWIEEMRDIAADPVRARDYLLRASMFDSRP